MTCLPAILLLQLKNAETRFEISRKTLKRNKDINKSHHCSICKERYSTEQHLDNHMLFHINNLFNCNLCSSSFITKNSLNSHMNRHAKRHYT